MNDFPLPCPGAARPRTVVTRLGVLVAALLALVMLPALAAAHRPHAARRIRHPHQARRGHDPRHGSATRAQHRDRRPHHARRARIAVAARPACPGAHARLGRVPSMVTEQATLCLLNVERSGFGLPALRDSRRLDRSAQEWTDTMVRDRAFGHGSDFAARISATGFRWSQVGENIADGFRTPAGAVTAWMHSLGHCENILDPDFREVGAGFDTTSAVGRRWRPGTWTLDLGLRAGQHARSRDWSPAEHCPY